MGGIMLPNERQSALTPDGERDPQQADAALPSSAQTGGASGVDAAQLVRCSSYAADAAGFMSSCLTMLLEHGISPLHEVDALQMWEELTVALILAGKIPQPKTWGEESGTLGKIEAGLHVLQGRFRLRDERLQASLRESQEIEGILNSPTTQSAANCAR
jgi:hypothetical protein